MSISPGLTSMHFKNLLLFLEVGQPFEPQLNMAAELAAVDGAALTGACACRAPALEISDGYALGPHAVSEVLARLETQVVQATAQIETAFQAAVMRHVLDGHWAPPSANPLAEDLALRARCFDLAIVGRPPGRDRTPYRLAELITLESGTPCLLLPPEPPPQLAIDHVVVAWNGSREAKRALQDGLGFLKRAERVTLVMLGGEPTTPQAMTSQTVQVDVLNHLTRHGIKAQLKAIDAPHGDAGAALLDYCAKNAADLLVMGAYGHSRARELILGGVTRKVLSEAALPVLLSH
ncbi:MAG: universal stress protein [Caulobacteraceae bacterium]|nr:universal stress protein [Caulobacteraceae bacterium]